MDKREILNLLVGKLQSEVEGLLSAARAAHEAATHEESRAEDSHDTRGLEASYLAGAQAQRAADLGALITAYRLMPLKDFAPGAAIEPGALVELLNPGAAGRKTHYFVVPRGGGAAVQLQGVTIQVIAPQSPLGEALIGRRSGEEIEVEAQGAVREYQVVGVK